VCVGLLCVLLLSSLAPDARGAPVQTVPIPTDADFLRTLSAPSIAPGDSGRLSYGVTDPASLGVSITQVVLTFQVYAFNGFPGGGNGALPVGNAPILDNGTVSGPSVSVAIGSVAAGATDGGSVGIATSTSTPAGTFAIRTEISFELNGSPAILRSRGWFTPGQWANATELSNGSASLTVAGLNALNVSGIIPETAVLVASNDWTWALALVLGGAFVLLAAGVWLYSRRGPGSTGGNG
jgi:hypothetical protein